MLSVIAFELERKCKELKDLLRDSKEVVVVKEKERVWLKEETVSRGCEIAAMREAVSKLKKEKEVDKNQKVPKADKVVQTEVVVGRVAGMQMPVCTYASVAAQVEEVSEGEGEPTDKMDIDPLGLPTSGKKATVVRGWDSHAQTYASDTHIWPSREGLYGAWGCLPWAIAGMHTGGGMSIRKEVGGESLVCSYFSSNIGRGGRYSVLWLSFSRGQLGLPKACI